MHGYEQNEIERQTEKKIKMIKQRRYRQQLLYVRLLLTALQEHNQRSSPDCLLLQLVAEAMKEREKSNTS